MNDSPEPAKFTEVDEWAARQGFGPYVSFAGTATDVGGDPTVPHSGFYLLRFANDSYYLGESVNLRARMGGHNSYWGSEIQDARFIRQNLSKPQLRKIEKRLIYELNGIIPDHCRNKTHASKSFGSDGLDEFLTSDEQAAWLDDPYRFNAGDSSPLKAMTPSQSVKYSTAAKHYLDHPGEAEATNLLRRYLDNCVPTPRRTEFQGWSVSTGTYGGARLLCVTVGRMETLVVTREMVGFIVVRESILVEGTSGIDEVLKRFTNVSAWHRHYDDAGKDTISLGADTPSAWTELLSAERVLRAAGQLVYDVMRKHPSVYTRYHCPQVVEYVYPEFQREEDVLQRSEVRTPADLIAAEALPAVQAEEVAAEQDAKSSNTELSEEELEFVEDDIVIYWFVNTGPKRLNRHTVADFLVNREWRMEPNPKYELHVQEMLPGERIAVRSRKNITKGVPFDRRGRQVSVMDIFLTGTIVANPGDGCSVKVDWDPQSEPLQWYLYTNQDTVWAVPAGRSNWDDQLIEFAFNGKDQDVDWWRNQHYWKDRFGDLPQ
ncbi:hypothetical protein BJF87_23280 [Gordonia sp. CNJ-863]|uniref:GIY-YIG nuclease family protein n=1 Tax=Gordonia TaxID=2053 RepID=UPI000969E696|nr:MULTISPECIES: GIY-YIG nuclease family protein [Gordonia]MDH3022635.1 GIY-YIG nuclease family protein [Gordonia alkanivorans]MDH3026866.1 GIY-YIG nuclease family protein [Gordonia alkanivorans]MDJ0010282.1 GIY-YIG nuclease family protein [Gordonia alkanivorans]MDJ0100123.1 GIY-YIG nuclease family protein [Gordonia alkanivorans]MDJ0495915.1 GIY-YIG nuclease family protein [Gordonia alkanivorans]